MQNKSEIVFIAYSFFIILFSLSIINAKIVIDESEGGVIIEKPKVFRGINITNNYYNITANYTINITNNNYYNISDYSGIALTNQSNDFTGNQTITDGNWWNGLFNWTVLTDWFSWDGATLSFNETKLNDTIADYTQNLSGGSDGDWIIKNSSWDYNFNDLKLSTIFYNVTQVAVITGTGEGVLVDIQSYNNIAYNVTEDASDLELRINFTGVEDFNNLIIRYKSTEEDEPHIILIQIWHYGDSSWEDYGTIPAIGSYHVVEFGVFDSGEHVSGGVVQVRAYQDEGVPAKTHEHNFDWITVSKGFGTPVGEEVDPLSIHTVAFASAFQTNFSESFDLNFSGLGLQYGNFNFTNFSSSFDLNFTALALEYGDFNFSDFQTGFNSNISQIAYGDFNFSDFQTSFNSNYSSVSLRNPFDQDLNTTNNVIFKNLNTTENITANNFFGEFGDLVSEANPDGVDAMRIKATGDNVDVVIGGMTGLFSVWNVADNTAVFYVTERGATDITGILDMNTNKIVGVVDPTANQDVATKKYVDDEIFSSGGGLWATNGTSIYNSTVSQVGIGTATPTHKLNVVGTINATEVCLADGTTCLSNMGVGDFSFTDFQAGFDSNFSALGLEYGNFNFTNFQAGFDSNFSALALEYGDFNFSDFQGAFNNNITNVQGDIKLDSDNSICFDPVCSSEIFDDGSLTFKQGAISFTLGELENNLDVPVSSLDNYIVRWAGLDGAVIQMSNASINDDGSAIFNGINSTSICLPDGTTCFSGAGLPTLWATNGTSLYNATVSQVGIGTSTPTQKLQIVDGNIELFSSTLSVSNNMKSGTTKVAAMAFGDSDGFTFQIGTIGREHSNDILRGITRFYLPPSGIYPIIIQNGTGNMLFNSDGTFLPTYELDVMGTVNATAFIGDGSGLTNVGGGKVERIDTGDVQWCDGNDGDTDTGDECCAIHSGSCYTIYKADGMGMLGLDDCDQDMGDVQFQAWCYYG